MATPILSDINDNFLLKFLVTPRWRLARHILMMSIILFIFSGGKTEHTGNVDDYVKLIFLAFFSFLLYFNMYVLTPKLLFKGKYIWFISLVIVILVLFFLLSLYIEKVIYPYLIIPEEKEEKDVVKDVINFVFIFCIVIAASTAVKLFQRWISDSYRIMELEKQRLRSELSQLKSQVNPHFLFNTLNNIHTLTRTDPQKASDILLKLSDLLRYQLYDSTQDHIMLGPDIIFLENFLNLEKIRRDNFSFNIAIEGDATRIAIPPFLFIPFVENAVKHSMDSFNSSRVQIDFKITDTQLLFTCINSRPDTTQVACKPGGIGLVNIQRRLQLLYPGSYHLQITEHINSYLVNLSIPL
jgi:LytS/YehU family sensor histidine kinase